MNSRIELSPKTIFLVLSIIFLLWFIITLKEIIFLIYVAFILMSAFKPLVDKMETKRIPRALSVILIYLVIISFLVFTGSTFIPQLVSQSITFAENLPNYLSVLSPYITLDYQMLAQQLAPVGENLLKVTFSLFNDIVGFFTVVVLSVYMLIGRKHLDSALNRIMGTHAAAIVSRIILRVEERLGAWVRGQAALALTIGVLTAVGLLILNIPYVLPLSIIAGILELIPNIGPILSAVPAALVAFTVSPFMALVTVGVYVIIQQLENHIVVPFVMNKVVGLSPLITIISLLIGAELAGIAGALMAVPTVVAIETIISEYVKIREEMH